MLNKKNSLIFFENTSCHQTSNIKHIINKLKIKNTYETYDNLCLNIQNVILEIPKYFYLNIVKNISKTLKKDFFNKSKLF